MTTVPVGQFNDVCLFGHFIDNNLTLWIPLTVFHQFYVHLSTYCTCSRDEIKKLSDRHLREVGVLISLWLEQRIGHKCDWELNDNFFPDSHVLHFSKWQELIGLLNVVENS